eukprot:m51a1_g128 hypothetical protein (539) ;mRNA; f:431022-433265
MYSPEEGELGGDDGGMDAPADVVDDRAAAAQQQQQQSPGRSAVWIARLPMGLTHEVLSRIGMSAPSPSDAILQRPAHPTATIVFSSGLDGVLTIGDSKHEFKLTHLERTAQREIYESRVVHATGRSASRALGGRSADASPEAYTPGGGPCPAAATTEFATSGDAHWLQLSASVGTAVCKVAFEGPVNGSMIKRIGDDAGKVAHSRRVALLNSASVDVTPLRASGPSKGGVLRPMRGGRGRGAHAGRGALTVTAAAHIAALRNATAPAVDPSARPALLHANKNRAIRLPGADGSSRSSGSMGKRRPMTLGDFMRETDSASTPPPPAAAPQPAAAGSAAAQAEGPTPVPPEATPPAVSPARTPNSNANPSMQQQQQQQQQRAEVADARMEAGMEESPPRTGDSGYVPGSAESASAVVAMDVGAEAEPSTPENLEDLGEPIDSRGEYERRARLYAKCARKYAAVLAEAEAVRAQFMKLAERREAAASAAEREPIDREILETYERRGTDDEERRARLTQMRQALVSARASMQRYVDETIPHF